MTFKTDLRGGLMSGEIIGWRIWTAVILFLYLGIGLSISSLELWKLLVAVGLIAAIDVISFKQGIEVGKRKAELDADVDWDDVDWDDDNFN